MLSYSTTNSESTGSNDTTRENRNRSRSVSIIPESHRSSNDVLETEEKLNENSDLIRKCGTEQPKEDRHCSSFFCRKIFLANLRPVLGTFLLALSLLLVGYSLLVGWETGNSTTSQQQQEALQSQWNEPVGSRDDSCPEPPLSTVFKASSVEDMKNAVVATDHPVCSEVGGRVLQEWNGNAIDAAVAVALCLGVANPASSGMGGGSFMLVLGKLREDAEEYTNYTNAKTDVIARGDKVMEVIDAREEAPSGAYSEMFQDAESLHASLNGGLAAGVPGELRGLELAHARFGSLPWAKVVQPAYDLAHGGVVVNRNLAFELRMTAKLIKTLNFTDFGLKEILTHNNNWDNILQEGDTLRNEVLARTLKDIQERGADAFYTGERANKLARDIQGNGGIITKQDLESYRPILRTPVMAKSVAGYMIVGVPPPSSGGPVIIGATRFLAGYVDPLSAQADSLTMHRLSEASKHVFAMRMSLSDPAYNAEVVSEVVHDLVESDYVDLLRRSTMDNTTLPLSKYGGAKWARIDDSVGQKKAVDAREGDRRRNRNLLRQFRYLNDNGTSHFSIVDKDGNSVAMTSSINIIFGSMTVSEGVVFGNTMDDFAQPEAPNFFGFRPSFANFILPGKRPLSSMSPTMVFGRNDELVMNLGGSGGPKIISSVLQVLLDVLWLGQPLLDAVIRPRIHDQLLYHGSSVLGIENSVTEDGTALVVPERTKQALLKRNHQLLEIDYTGTVQVVYRDVETNTWSAVSDPRKGGIPFGY